MERIHYARTAMVLRWYHDWATLPTLVLSLYRALHTLWLHSIRFDYARSTPLSRWHYVYHVCAMLLVRLSRLRYAPSTFIRACKSKKQLCAGAGSKPKNSKAWTTAIWHDYTAFLRRPSNWRMVVESAMSVAGAGLSEMGGLDVICYLEWIYA